MSTTIAPPAASGLTTSLAPGRPRGFFARMKAMAMAYKRSWECRAAVATLRTLDDHLLKDIGLDRSEIVSMVYGQGDATRRHRI